MGSVHRRLCHFAYACRYKIEFNSTYGSATNRLMNGYSLRDSPRLFTMPLEVQVRVAE